MNMLIMFISKQDISRSTANARWRFSSFLITILENVHIGSRLKSKLGKSFLYLNIVNGDLRREHGETFPPYADEQNSLLPSL